MKLKPGSWSRGRALGTAGLLFHQLPGWISWDAPLGHARTGLRCAERARDGGSWEDVLPETPWPVFPLLQYSGKNSKPSWFGKDMDWEKSSLGPSAQHVAPAGHLSSLSCHKHEITNPYQVFQ